MGKGENYMTNEELIKLGYEMLGETEGEIKIPPMKPMREFIKTSIEALKLRPKGKWIHWTDDYKDYVTCSCCEYGEEGEVLLSDKTPFCPICGADMKGDTE